MTRAGHLSRPSSRALRWHGGNSGLADWLVKMAVLEFAWLEDEPHEVRCRRESHHWHVQVDARAVATLLDGWLERRPDLARVGWSSDDERARSAPGRPRPW